MASTDSEAKWALITGGASGIGAAFASELAARGYALRLVDKQRDALAAVARDIEARHAVPVVQIVADLQNTADQDEVIEDIAGSSALDLLINNAGFGEPELFKNVAPENHAAMLQVHVVAPVRFSRAALPAMIARNQGAIINVGSLIQYVRTPGNTMYGSTKLFLDTFSHGLSLEVRRHGIQVQSLMPGYTSTNFGNTNAYDRRPRSVVPGFLWSSAGSVVDASLRQLGSGTVRCVPGRLNRLLEIALRRELLPAWLIRSRIA